ncbi:MurR/RpiR family transcriptional regulator [Suicoccus acidiformans]|uniref:MurR/RpiR family transcriptional regulator n=1 Tax=Suicoccus acidiformans TaxID=2036206 RepID=A0A347WKW0_9LACT|nr:MurR/RpiR family transcriptional regulator [Suicoccus acidiformans]AXY25717.1 MurR/RpiR family transcriptional regulator [Suicoccus acidiformans]
MDYNEIIIKHYDELTENELSMATYINQNRYDVTRMTAQEFADKNYTSKTSVIRMCKKIGFKGFGELKSYLKWLNDDKITRTLQDFQNLKSNVIKDYESTIEYIKQSDWSEIFETVLKSKSIYTLYTGLTQSNQAAEFQRLFLLIGKPIIDIPTAADSNEFRRISERITSEDIIIIISLSGENLKIVKYLELIEYSGAKIISLTQPTTNYLAGKADFNLFANTSTAPMPKDWWIRSASSFYLVIESFCFGYIDYLKLKEREQDD